MLAKFEDQYDFIQTFIETDNKGVYLVRHKSLEVYRVLKRSYLNSHDAEALRAEGTFLKSLTAVDSFVPRILDMGQDGDFLYIIEEYIEGQSLKSYFYKNKTDISHTIILFRKLCDIVESLHGNKLGVILHLDIKPENIIISGDEVYLIDFGNAAYKGQKSIGCGTKDYASYEQYMGGTVDERADVFALGKVLCYMLFNNVSDDFIRTVSEETGKVPAYLINIILRCTEKNPDRRFRNVKSLMEELTDEAMKPSIETIGVVGVRHGIGATYVSMALVRELSLKGISAYYREENDSMDAWEILKVNNKSLDACGMYEAMGCKIMPKLSDALLLKENKCRVCVVDYGVYEEDCVPRLVKSDKIVVVGGDTDMTRSKTRLVYDNLKAMSDTYLILNLSKKSRIECMAEYDGKTYALSYRGRPKHMYQRLLLKPKGSKR